MSWDISPTKEGYEEAAGMIQTMKERGHRVGDDNSGTIKKVDDYFNGNVLSGNKFFL